MVEHCGQMERTSMRVLISGGFDPIHVGHVRYIKEAMNLGDKLTILLNDDKWLVRKKGKYFMKQEDRREILQAMLRPEDQVLIYSSGEDDVALGIRTLRPDIFAKGGDRNFASLPLAEINACKEVGCDIYTAIGGEKVRSSSELLKTYGSKA